MTACAALLIPLLLAFDEPAAPADKQPEVTVQFLRDVLRSQLDSAQSLSTEYSISQQPLAPPAKGWGPTAYKLFVDGNRIAVHIKDSARPQSDRSYMFDGHDTYSVSHKHGPSPVVEVFAERTRNVDVSTQPLDAVGARVRLAGVPLTTLMDDPSCQLEGSDNLNGVFCWRVKVNAIDKRAESPILVRAWFDPTHDYLPRQITIHREGMSPAEFEWTWAVMKFNRTVAEAGLRWFPVLSEFRQPLSVQTLTVSAFEINPAFPQYTFTPDLRSNAEVRDLRDPSKLRVFVSSDAASVNQRAKEVAIAARETAVPPIAADTFDHSAAPVQSDYSVQVLFWMSLACLEAAK